MMKILVIFLLLGYVKISFSQINSSTVQDFKPEISQFPKSPEAAAFSKFIDIPATTHTGVMNVSVPIYNFDFNGQNFPISLEYNTSGIKLDEIASRVGLGWTLNIGGVSLSKQVMGSPDQPQSVKADVSTGFNPDGHFDVGSDTEKALKAIGYILNDYPIDFLPDLYNYSLLNNSGQFILDATKKEPLKIPSSNTNINKIPNNGGNYNYLIKDDNGNEYYFSLIRSKFNVNTCTSYHNILNRYPIDEYLINYIKSPNNDIIEFEYIENSDLIKYSTSTEIKRLLSYQRNGIRPPILNYNCTNYMVMGDGTVEADKLLSKIKFKNGEIEFVYGADRRKDVLNDKYISSIIVRNPSTIIKQYKLNLGGENGYFISDESYNPEHDYLKGNNYRLKLSDVEETNSGQKYSFEYYTGNLPPRLTLKKDFWGVYNGRFGVFSKSAYYDYALNRMTSFNSGDDLSADISYGRIGNLKKITYPTGGTQELFYENDDFTVPNHYNELYNSLGIIDNGEGKTGSLRIAKVILNGDNGEKIEKRFTYIDPETGKTSGVNYGTFNLNSVRKDVILNESDFAGTTRMFYNYLTNNPGWQLTTINGKSVGYSFVQEIVENSNEPSKNYKTTYEYYHDSESYENDWTKYDPNSLANMYYPIFDPERGLLKTKKYFNENNSLVKKDSLEYNYDPFFNRESSIIHNGNMLYRGIEVARNNVSCAGTCYHEFDWFPFDIKTFWIQNKKTTTTDYLSNGEVVTTVEYNYEPDYKHLNPTNVVTTNSKGEILTTEYQYPPDLVAQESYINELNDANRISEPVVVKQKVGNTYVSEIHNQYNIFHGLIQKSAVHQKKGSGININTTTDKKITYNSYDNKGNLTQYTLEDGTPVSILWGYNGQYPIAKVEGLPYNATISSLAGTLQGLSNNGTLSAGSFESLRNLSGAVVTCYIYKPLVGVTTIIRPNGQKETYEYDASGRLMHVKDHNGNILKKMDYHYKN